MAARRPPTTSRARTNSISGPNAFSKPPVSSRPRTAMSKSNPSIRGLANSTDDQPEVPPLPPSASHSRIMGKGTQDSESNIQVVIRCRRRSDREIQENSPMIVTSSGAKSTDVTIETSAPVSSLGVVTLPPTRTYPFDLVFGPEADQAMIYHDVVSPMLDEVLQGYNCTLFAYGQTGTGKTYTMQGDLEPTPMGNPSANAGMIPRVLFRLFHALETTAADYSVKISYVELYNEELRDLLTSELSAPIGNAQPMGKGSNSNTNEGQGGLKIFDDASKKGVIIQGLEELPVKDASDALALLTKGSHRRQIAATKFNDHSSRSHSVFSITVHIKETSNMGDDLLKVGKLNLVDLAGSENIGRSGAENKRAREAGMINQSLLTLGRVINALVDRSSHVPYRESKLTRLLQDSLGGRTKTCIIATVSPARSNMEETLSTLDYAMRAKSIRNKPEVNQRMTRNALLKEYVVEIERLKADVLAAREKNGIFFSEETWNQMSAEQELRQTEMEEAKKHVEIVESQMRNVREEFEQSIALLMKRDKELGLTKEKLKETEGTLGVKEGQLKVAQVALKEEVVVREAYQMSEGVLDGVAGGLKKIAGESIQDVGGLFDKLQRKTTVFTSNTKAVTGHTKNISADVKALSSKLEEFIKTSNHTTTRLRSESKQYQTTELETLASQSERIGTELHRVQEALQVIESQDTVSSEAIVEIQNAVKEAQASFQNGFTSWSGTLRTSCESICQELQKNGINGLTTVEKAIQALGSLIEIIVTDAKKYVDSERDAILQAKALAHTAADTEITRLRAQNDFLVRMLESEKVKADKAKDDLIQRVSVLLGEFTSARDQSLRAAVAHVQADNEKAEESMLHFDAGHTELIDGVVARGAKSLTSFSKGGSDGKRTRDGALKNLNSAKSTLKDGVVKMQHSVSESMTTYSNEVEKQANTLGNTSTNAVDRHNRSKRARIDATNSMATGVQSEYRHVQKSIASTSRNIEGFAGRVASETIGLANMTSTYHKAASTDLSSIHDSTRSLAEQATKEDTPTGSTPRKRVWQYVDQWELTQNRDALLNAWRKRSGSNASVDTFMNENTPPQMMVTEEDAMPVDCVTSPSESHRVDGEDVQPESPIAVSLASSASSTSIPIARPVMQKKTSSKSGLPSLGTLTDLPTNLITQRGSRRAR